jgi:inner membrane transporter RhtA
MSLSAGTVVASVPTTAYFITSAIFHTLGPAFAVLLFPLTGVQGVAWLRIAAAAVVLGILFRPWRAFAAASLSERRLLVALGAVLGLMNTFFYLALDRLPLATVSAIEFFGPVAIAAFGVRNLRNLVAFLAAFGGVYVLLNVTISVEPLGLILAGANCIGFMSYILLAHRIAQDGGVDGVHLLAAAMVVSLVVVSPLGLGPAASLMGQPWLLAAGIGVGICSSVIPYLCDQIAMARVPKSTYALMLAILPVSAAGIGLVVLRQVPSPLEALGIALVVAGVALHQVSDDPAAHR